MSKELDLAKAKAQADHLGIRLHPKSGYAKTIAAIEDHLAKNPDAEPLSEAELDSLVSPELDTPVQEPVAEAPKAIFLNDPANTPPPPRKETPQERKARISREAKRIVRIRVTPNDPDLAKRNGEIITASNSIVPTARKYIPFGADWTAPAIIVNVLKERSYTRFFRKKVNGKEQTETEQAPAFNVVILDDFTPEEIAELKRDQLLKQGQLNE